MWKKYSPAALRDCLKEIKVIFMDEFVLYNTI
jgi:hypothetical protein